MGALASSKQAVRPNFTINAGKLFIGGEWRDSSTGKTFQSIDPSNEEPLAQIAEGTSEDANAAVEAASEAFERGEWSRMSPHRRGELLWKVGDLIKENAEELAFLEAADAGKLFRDVKSIDVPHVANMFHYFAGWASKLDGSTKDAPLKHLNQFAFTRREPLGVVAAVSPFNFPLVLSIHKIAPALAAGNTVVHKPASTTPLSALKIAQLIQKAGIPPGVFNVVTGPGRTVGQTLITHPLVEKVSLTGSTTTGKNMIRDSAETVKHVTMELGGKSANLVFADADLDAAVETAYLGMFYNKGEICYAGSRMLVERKIYAEMVERVAARANKVRIGDPFSDDSDSGPIIDATEYKNVLRYMDVGRKDGARLVAGGDKYDTGTGKGFYVQSTVFADVKPEMTIAREETFGPILSMIPFDNADEAVRIANDSLYGLASGIQTRDIAKAIRVSTQLKAGTVWVNTYGQFDPSTPFGGFKQSGYGRENGFEVLESYTQPKTVYINLGA